MYEGLGQFVKIKRQQMGLSLREFGKLCNMSHTHIDSIEKGVDVRTGRSVNLTGATVAKLAEALGMSASELASVCSKKETADIVPTDRQLKLALFSDADADDSLLDEVKRFALFIKNKG